MKKRAIKIATASVVAASSFAAVAPFSTEAAVNVSASVTKATTQMKKAQDTYTNAAAKGQLASAASVQTQVDLAKKYYDEAVKVIAKSGGTKKATYTKQLNAALPYFNNAKYYIVAVKYAADLKVKADKLQTAVNKKDVKYVNANFSSFSAEIAKAEGKVKNYVSGAAGEKVVIAKYITPAKKVVTTVNAYLNSVTSVSAIKDIVVNEGAKSVALPKTVSVKLVNGKTASKSVVWSGKYDLNKPSTYTLKGAVAGTTLTASVKVVVKVDEAKVYAALKQAAENSVKAYEDLANGDLSTQALIDAAKVAGSAVKLDGLNVTDKTALELRVAAADATVAAAQKAIDDAKTYAELMLTAENNVKAYEDLANGDLSTQALIDVAKAAKAVIHLEGLLDGDKAPLQLRVEAADAKVAAAQAYLNLPVADSAVATNANTIQVTLPTDTKLTEADLVGKVVTLKAGETTLTATYVEKSLAEGKANFALESGKSLVDATIYTVSADWARFTKADFVAKVAPAYAQTFEKQTTEVLTDNYYWSEDYYWNSHKVYFTAKNQYGEALNIDSTNTAGVTVKATLNGMPLSNSEVSYTPGQNFVGVNRELAANDQLVITLVSNKVESTLSYTVIKTTEENYAKPSSLQVSADKTSIASGNTATLTATVKDQYNNPINVNNGDIRWFVNGVEDKDQTNATYTFAQTDSKAYDVKAFYADNTKLSQGVTINVGAAVLKSLEVSPVDGTVNNQEDAQVFTITQNAGALLNPSDLKYVVTGKPTAAKDSDVKVTFAYGQDNSATKEDESKIIYATVNTTVAGTYKFKVFTGSAIDAKDAVVSSEQSVTSVIRQDVTAINVDDFAANELTVGKDVIKAVKFTNNHGEEVDVNRGVIQVAHTLGMGVTLLNKDKAPALEEEAVKFIQFNGLKVGQDTVTLVKGSVSKTITTNTQAASTVNSINATGLTGDNAIIAGDVNAVKYITLNVADQYNVPVLATNNLVVQVKAPGANSRFVDSPMASLVYLDKDNKPTTSQANAVKVAVAIDPTQAVDNDDKPLAGDYTVQISDIATGKVTKEVTVTAKAARVLTTVTATATNQQFALGASGAINIVTKDQYGQLIKLSADDLSNASVKSDTNGKGIIEGVTDSVSSAELNEVIKDSKFAGYSFAVKAASKGNATLTFEIGGKTVTVNVGVDSVESLVNSLKLSTDAAQKSLYSTKGADNVDVALKTTAFNSAGNEVPVTNDDLTYSVDSITGTVVDGTSVAASKDIIQISNDGKVNVTNETFKGSVTIKVTSSNLKTSTITLNFDSAVSVPVTGTTAVAAADVTRLDSDTSRTGIQVALDGKGTDESNGAVAFTLTAVDQYGNPFEITESEAKVTTGDSSVLAIDKASDTVIVTAKGAGDANVYVQYNGDTIVLNFHVTKDAVDAANAPE